LNEGYGLTEASPVLTVTRPEGSVVSGSVGQPLPGVEIKIHEPNRRGVGEVIARGPNVMAGYYGNEKATAETLRDGWLYTGDLGRLDEDGNLYIVGRSKELIVDRNGKNVYPDELEELYANEDLIKELAVVGLPDGVGEQVAAIVVPNRDSNEEGLEKKIEAHVHEVSAKLPLYKRVKTLELTDDELPRTATRKVKRRELVAWLQQKRQLTAPGGTASEADKNWLLDLVARVSEKPRDAVHLDASLDELGFDSLMYSELSGAIETRTGESLTTDVLMSLSGIRELADSLRRRPQHRGKDQVRKKQEAETIELPPLVQEVGRKGLSVMQRWFYHDALNPELKGRANIPDYTHFIVVANHASHLDMGLVKMALGEAGENLVVLAAADYFFDNKVKRTIFENFTNLVPMERKGSLRKSLEWAFRLLEQGYNVLVFPEGTRSRTGVIKPFQRGIGHLVLRAKVGILPVHLSTFGALPPGTWYPQSRDVSASIGVFLSYETLTRVSDGLSRSNSERAVALLAQRMVEHERDGTKVDLEVDVKNVHEHFMAEKKAKQPVTVGKNNS